MCRLGPSSRTGHMQPYEDGGPRRVGVRPEPPWPRDRSGASLQALDPVPMLSRQHIDLMGRDLHRRAFPGEGMQVVLHQQPKSGPGIGDRVHTLSQLLEKGLQASPLDQKADLFLTPHIAVQPRQIHPGGSRNVPDARSMESTLGEHNGRGLHDLQKFLMVGWTVIHVDEVSSRVVDWDDQAAILSASSWSSRPGCSPSMNVAPVRTSGSSSERCTDRSMKGGRSGTNHLQAGMNPHAVRDLRAGRSCHSRRGRSHRSHISHASTTPLTPL